MTDYIQRYGVRVKPREIVSSNFWEPDNIPHMQAGWFQRLVAAIEADGRSLTAISKEAGLGVNYVWQMINNKKEPGTGPFVKLLNVLGTGASLKIILDLEITDEDFEFLRAMSLVNPDRRQAVAQLLETLLIGEEPPEP